jgi:hypothetical protein
MRRCPINWKSRHIKGHRDDDGNAVLDSWAILNIEMDGKAKAYWALNQHSHHGQQRVYGEVWALWKGGMKVCSDIGAVVTEERHGTRGKEYWDEKGRFHEGTSDMIDWKATGTAMKAVPPNRQRWVTKHVSGFCATGKMMMRWNKRPSAVCPRCDDEEDARHVWVCQGAGANEVWEQSMASLYSHVADETDTPKYGRRDL